MIKFGDIRRILEKWTVDCTDCQLREWEYREEDVDDGIYPYETCNPDCSTYYAKKIKEEVLTLLDKEEVSTKPLHSIPIDLRFKGMVNELPSEAQEGDLWYLQSDDQGVKTGNYYYFEGRWNHLPLESIL